MEVVVLADRGFIHAEAITAITAELRWHYRISPSATLRERIKRNT
jgi:hypothetical protein